MKLDEPDHRSLALWAADCAGRVLPYFEEGRPGDDRPRRAVEAGMAWARGEMGVGEARAAAIASHAAAREADPASACASARAAARAAGHAAATAHMAAHAPHAADYAIRAVSSDEGLDEHAVAEERERQHRSLPGHLRTRVFPIR
jgi:hypothetical protein